MLANYPLSVLVNGQALNITARVTADSTDFGLMGCRDTLPDLEDLADGLLSALEELRTAIRGSAGCRKTRQPISPSSLNPLGEQRRNVLLAFR